MRASLNWCDYDSSRGDSAHVWISGVGRTTMSQPEWPLLVELWTSSDH